MNPIKCSNCNSNDMEMHQFYWQCNACLTKHELNQPVIKEVISGVTPAYSWTNASSPSVSMKHAQIPFSHSQIDNYLRKNK